MTHDPRRVELRLDPTLIAALDAEARRLHLTSRSAAATIIIRRGLGLDDQPDISARLAALEARFSTS